MPTTGATTWKQAFLPWKDRVLAVTGLALNGTTVTMRSSYIELQYWRPLGLEQVERFEFQDDPPSGYFSDALRAYAVKIYRRGATVEWTDDLTAAAAAPAAAPPSLPPPPAPGPRVRPSRR